MRYDLTKESIVKIRAGRSLGVAAVAALAVSLPLAVDAAAEPDPTTPAARVPDPQGPGCDDFKEAVPDWKELNSDTVGPALAAIPEISTFNGLISGQVNPGANIIPVLENGLYVVFAPTNEAFAALPPGQLQALKDSSVEELTRFGYYHVFLGLLAPDDVHGERPTQDGALIKVTGKGGDVEVNDTAKVVCGGIQASNAQIYLIDAVLDPDQAPGATRSPGTTETSEPTEATETTEAPAAPETTATTAEAEPPQEG